MVVRKTLGFILGILGVVGIAAWSIPEIKNVIPNMSKIVSTLGGDTMLIIVSAVLVVLGLFLITKGGHGRKHAEVPIYHGKDIVGYRRH